MTRALRHGEWTLEDIRASLRDLAAAEGRVHRHFSELLAGEFERERRARQNAALVEILESGRDRER